MLLNDVMPHACELNVHYLFLLLQMTDTVTHHAVPMTCLHLCSLSVGTVNSFK